MTLDAGIKTTLLVAREVPPYGFFLSGGGQDVLLPYGEAEPRPKVGEKIDVFLFYDSKDRLTATRKEPLLTYGELALLEVADTNARLGCFLDMGIGKHLLLPASELPKMRNEWPIKGDRVYVMMSSDKAGRPLAVAARDTQLADKCARAPVSWKNRRVSARVYRVTDKATFAICEAGMPGFGVIGMVHASERIRPLRLGELFEARVAYIRDDGRVNLALRPQKEISRMEDAERILRYLRERPNGTMPYSDATSADIIAEKFSISKAAFKRALGKLLKEGKIVQENGWTRLKK
ncbi:MAG TPA: S1-like domain-containing RNA-binding protein [Bacilli bacterium]